MVKNKKLVVVVDEDMHRKAKIKAAQTGKPISDIIRGCIEQWTKDVVLPPEKSGG